MYQRNATLLIRSDLCNKRTSTAIKYKDYNAFIVKDTIKTFVSKCSQSSIGIHSFSFQCIFQYDCEIYVTYDDKIFSPQ
jgi:hypothetical protein